MHRDDYLTDFKTQAQTAGSSLQQAGEKINQELRLLTGYPFQVTDGAGPAPAPASGGATSSEGAVIDAQMRAVLGRPLGKGGVTYFALGHCHSPLSNVQPFVDASVEASGTTPKTFRGSWETPEFETLLKNALKWGVAAART